jgi:Xaa-Pro aminopeptidase
MARMTKDPAEAAAIRATSALTGEVVAATLRFLQSHRVGPDETLLQADGAVLTVKDVKAFVNRELAGRELEATEGFIFALAADAGVGHSAGKPNDVLRLGVPIVFDIFPRSRNGYYTDLTRTFCLDYAPAAVAEAYAQVRELFEQVLAALAAGELASRYQEMTCDYFEAHGHRSVRQDRATTIGYTHSLGHGVGLQVHENPLIATIPGRTDRLIPGAVFTIEPGLYYPECGFGVRLEDTVYCDPAGTFHRLTEFPYDLLVPMS